MKAPTRPELPKTQPKSPRRLLELLILFTNLVKRVWVERRLQRKLAADLADAPHPLPVGLVLLEQVGHWHVKLAWMHRHPGTQEDDV